MTARMHVCTNTLIERYPHTCTGTQRHLQTHTLTRTYANALTHPGTRPTLQSACVLIGCHLPSSPSASSPSGSAGSGSICPCLPASLQGELVPAPAKVPEESRKTGTLQSLKSPHPTGTNQRSSPELAPGLYRDHRVAIH